MSIQTLSPQQRAGRITWFLANVGRPVSVPEIARYAGISTRSVRTVLENLAAAGVPVEKAAPGRWSVGPAVECEPPAPPQPKRDRFEDLITVAAAAAEVGVHPETIRRWIRAGDVAAVVVGNSYLIARSELEEM